MSIQEVAFNKRLELNFRYVCNCLLIADADGDGNLELTAGSRDGVLSVFKLDQTEPWRMSPPMATPSGSIGGPFGLVTALAAGDLFNKDATVLVSIAADGECFVFRLTGTGAAGQQVPTDVILQPCFRQLLPSNIKSAYIGDIDGDGRCELIVALTDRVVRTYRFLPCANSTGSSGRGATGSTGSSGVTFCCGMLVALNKWESPAQITAFSVCPSGQQPQAGVTVLVSQPGDKYLLLKPKLCAENDPSDSLSDISVVYCETKRSTLYGPAEHCVGRRSIDVRGDATSGRRKKRLFITSNSYRIDLFHLISRYVTAIDHDNEYKIEFPTPIFSMAAAKVPDQNTDSQNYRELLLACDWNSNVYTCGIERMMEKNEESADGGKQRRVTAMVNMKVYGPIMVFTAGYSQSMAHDELYVAVSTCEEKLFLYTVRVGKLLRFLDEAVGM